MLPLHLDLLTLPVVGLIEDHQQQHRTQVVYGLFSLALCVMGLLGNISSLCFITRMQRKPLLYHFLSVLLTSDTITLLLITTATPYYYSSTFIGIRVAAIYLVHLLNPLINALLAASTLVIFVMVLMRLLAITAPVPGSGATRHLLARYVANLILQRHQLILVACFLLAAVLYLPTAWRYSVVEVSGGEGYKAVVNQDLLSSTSYRFYSILILILIKILPIFVILGLSLTGAIYLILDSFKEAEDKRQNLTDPAQEHCRQPGQHNLMSLTYSTMLIYLFSTLFPTLLPLLQLTLLIPNDDGPMWSLHYISYFIYLLACGGKGYVWLLVSNLYRTQAKLTLSGISLTQQNLRCPYCSKSYPPNYRMPPLSTMVSQGASRTVYYVPESKRMQLSTATENDMDLKRSTGLINIIEAESRFDLEGDDTMVREDQQRMERMARGRAHTSPMITTQLRQVDVVARRGSQEVTGMFYKALAVEGSVNEGAEVREIRAPRVADGRETSVDLEEGDEDWLFFEPAARSSLVRRQRPGHTVTSRAVVGYFADLLALEDAI